MSKIKSQTWVSNIHHDFGGNRRHNTPLNLGHFCVQQTIVDVTCISLRATDCHQGLIHQGRGRITATNDSRNTKLSGNNGCVTSTPTSVGHDGTRQFHDGLPIGVSHIGNQNIASLHKTHFSRAIDQPDGSSANFLANRSALRKQTAFRLQFVTNFGLSNLLTFDCFRTCLQYVKLSVISIFSPLYVHCTLVVLFNQYSILSKLHNVFIRERIPVSHFRWNIYRGYRMTQLGFFH